MPTSPASPPYFLHHQQNQKEATAFVSQPHTPPSPASLRMSSSAHHGHDHSFPTPPSSHIPQSTSPSSHIPQSISPNMTTDPVDTDMADAPESAYPLQLLCQTPHPISRPHPSENLIELYGLQKIASSVARKDPLTGEKINKLRKSYEGKVKNFGLNGRNKPTDVPGELRGFMEWPEEGWYDQRVHGKELEKAESGPLMAKLSRALQMAPGRLPVDEHDKWKNLLALDDGGNKTPLAVNKNPAQQAMLKSQASSMRASAPASPRASHPNGIRPDRVNKKRRYDESSYAGYSEGYQDDDGYSTGGMDDRRNSATKKRRKEYPANFDASGGSPGFSNGMLGVGVKSS